MDAALSAEAAAAPTQRSRFVRAARGMVASPHGLATGAGVDALRRGGSAVDATIMAAAVLAVVYPHMCSIGGDAFALVFDPRRRELVGLNGSGRSPATASIETLRARGLTSMPTRGTLSITVPGVVDAWRELAVRFGRLPLEELLAPAVAFACDGFPVTKRLALAIAANAPELRDLPFARVFSPNGPPREGATLRLPALARTLERIAAEPDSFYRGQLARELSAAVRGAGGLLAEEDLAAHRSTWVRPVSSEYRGLTIAELPPNSAGIITLLSLRLIERLELGDGDINDPRRIDSMVRAIRAAFAFARPLISDPEWVEAPIEDVLADARIDRLVEALRRGVNPRDHERLRGDTVYLCAVDSEGMACSFIQSVYFPFGSGFVAEDTGVLFQNRGAYFSMHPQELNALAPRKRTYHTLMPAMSLRAGRPWLVFGTMGADGQPQTQVQVVTGIIDYGLDVQAAIDAPRWLAGRALVSDADDALTLEARFPPELDRLLSARGHVVHRTESWSELMGHAQAIRIAEAGLEGGADRRGDGSALGY
jgi:gamma-glutamyltranspeptidase/glutathione hydrolase